MKARKAVSIILVLVPWALFAAGAVLSIWLSCAPSEGGEIIALVYLGILAAWTAVPLAAIALKLGQNAPDRFVKVMAVIDLVLSVPVVLITIPFMIDVIKSVVSSIFEK